MNMLCSNDIHDHFTGRRSCGAAAFSSQRPSHIHHSHSSRCASLNCHMPFLPPVSSQLFYCHLSVFFWQLSCVFLAACRFSFFALISLPHRLLSTFIWIFLFACQYFNAYFLVILFLWIFSLNRRNSTKKATITTENNSSASLPLQTNLPAVVPTPRRPDLLGSTVFATISRAEAEARPAMKSFDKVPPEIPPAGTQPIEQPLHRVSFVLNKFIK